MPQPPEAPRDDTRRTTDPSRAPQENPADEVPPGTPGSGETVCRRCGGSGRLEGKGCPDCGGSGRINAGIGGG